jgi:uncharacterized protein YdgA (DUF945 family)
MNVDTKKLQESLDYINSINQCDLDDITWNGRKSDDLAINIKAERFKFMGLDNIDFARFNGIVD